MSTNLALQWTLAACAALAGTFPAQAVSSDTAPTAYEDATAKSLSWRAVSGAKLAGRSALAVGAPFDPDCIEGLDNEAAVGPLADYLRDTFGVRELASLNHFHGSHVGRKYTRALVENTLAGGHLDSATVLFTLSESFDIMAFLLTPAGSRLSRLEAEPDQALNVIYQTLVPRLYETCLLPGTTTP